jgi:hypothetical protein
MRSLTDPQRVPPLALEGSGPAKLVRLAEGNRVKQIMQRQGGAVLLIAQSSSPDPSEALLHSAAGVTGS